MAQICREDVCDQNAIRAQFTFRVKTENALAGKLRCFEKRPDRDYATVDEVFASISISPACGSRPLKKAIAKTSSRS